MRTSNARLLLWRTRKPTMLWSHFWCGSSWRPWWNNKGILLDRILLSFLLKLPVSQSTLKRHHNSLTSRQRSTSLPNSCSEDILMKQLRVRSEMACSLMLSFLPGASSLTTNAVLNRLKADSFKPDLWATRWPPWLLLLKERLHQFWQTHHLMIILAGELMQLSFWLTWMALRYKLFINWEEH